MSVDNPDVIDAIGTDRTTGVVVLTVSDHLEWNDDHLLTLQEKLNGYLHFILEGQLLESYPSARNRLVQIEVIHKYPPDAKGLAFLARAAESIGEYEIGFTHRSLPEGY